MKSKLKINVKSNKGFLMSDVIIAVIIISIFAGVIGTSMVNTYKMQAETRIMTKVGLYAVEILEKIDEVDYDEVTDTMDLSQINIPGNIRVKLKVLQEKPDNGIKNVKLDIKYKFKDKINNLLFEKIKVKEL